MYENLKFVALDKEIHSDILEAEKRQRNLVRGNTLFGGIQKNIRR